jgi:hypothetical protein
MVQGQVHEFGKAYPAMPGDADPDLGFGGGFHDISSHKEALAGPRPFGARLRGTCQRLRLTTAWAQPAFLVGYDYPTGPIRKQAWNS